MMSPHESPFLYDIKRLAGLDESLASYLGSTGSTLADAAAAFSPSINQLVQSGHFVHGGSSVAQALSASGAAWPSARDSLAQALAQHAGATVASARDLLPGAGLASAAAAFDSLQSAEMAACLALEDSMRMSLARRTEVEQALSTRREWDDAQHALKKAMGLLPLTQSDQMAELSRLSTVQDACAFHRLSEKLTVERAIQDALGMTVGSRNELQQALPAHSAWDDAQRTIQNLSGLAPLSAGQFAELCGSAELQTEDLTESLQPLQYIPMEVPTRVERQVRDEETFSIDLAQLRQGVPEPNVVMTILANGEEFLVDVVEPALGGMLRLGGTIQEHPSTMLIDPRRPPQFVCVALALRDRSASTSATDEGVVDDEEPPTTLH